MSTCAPVTHHCAHQALDDGLALLKVEKLQILSQELPKRLSIIDNLAPMDGLLLRPSHLLPFLIDLHHLDAECPSPTL